MQIFKLAFFWANVFSAVNFFNFDFRVFLGVFEIWNKFRNAGMTGYHCIIETSIPDSNGITEFVFVCSYCTVDAPFFNLESGESFPRSENAGQSNIFFSKL